MKEYQDIITKNSNKNIIKSTEMGYKPLTWKKKDKYLILWCDGLTTTTQRFTKEFKEDFKVRRTI